MYFSTQLLATLYDFFPIVISLSVSESSQTLLYLDNTTVQCEIMILQEVGLEIFSLAWVDPSGMSIDQNGDNSFVANYINNTESASLDLELRGVLLSQAGVYACVATVGLPDMEFNVTRNVTYNVQGNFGSIIIIIYIIIIMNFYFCFSSKAFCER